MKKNFKTSRTKKSSDRNASTDELNSVDTGKKKISDYEEKVAES